MEGKYESSEDPHPLCPWPARSYSCSFCKREFRSAQALGGHMNVHRRDKAKLRSTLPSWLNSHECPKPNPNPSLGSSSSSSSSSPSPLASENFSYTHHSQIFSPSLSTCKEKRPITSSHQISLLNPQSREVNRSKKAVKRGYGVENLMGFADQGEQQQEASYKNDNGITLELGIGLLKQPKEKKIDLELRLGNF